jgi:hypothetical protein
MLYSFEPHDQLADHSDSLSDELLMEAVQGENAQALE